MSPESLLAVHIKVPREAVVPLMLASIALVVLALAGTALAEWKRKHPGGARIAGFIVGLGLTAGALFMLSQIVPRADENDRVHEGIYYFSFFDGPIVGFLGIMAAVMWRWARQRWIGLGVGLGIGGALIVKPFAVPLRHIFDGKEYLRHAMDLEHLSFIGPGIAVVIAALIVGLTKPR